MYNSFTFLQLKLEKNFRMSIWIFYILFHARIWVYLHSYFIRLICLSDYFYSCMPPNKILMKPHGRSCLSLKKQIFQPILPFIPETMAATVNGTSNWRYVGIEVDASLHKFPLQKQTLSPPPLSLHPAVASRIPHNKWVVPKEARDKK